VGKFQCILSGPSQIDQFDRFSAISQTWGESIKKGDFSINSRDNFLKKHGKWQKEAQGNAPKGFTVSLFKTVSRHFGLPF